MQPTETSIYLTEIRRLPDSAEFQLTWSDGHSSKLDYDYIRGFCPCALCQGHGSNEVAFHPPRKPVTPETIEPVGNYGISITWSDRHTTGIYRFDFLRRICTCSLCRPGGTEPPTSIRL